MTVRELIDELQQYPQNANVAINENIDKKSVEEIDSVIFSNGNVVLS